MQGDVLGYFWYAPQFLITMGPINFIEILGYLGYILQMSGIKGIVSEPSFL